SPWRWAAGRFTKCWRDSLTSTKYRRCGTVMTSLRRRLMSTQTVPLAPAPFVTSEVPDFAREMGVEQYLQPLIDLTRQVYPTATQFKVFVEEDWEIADEFSIVLEL